VSHLADTRVDGDEPLPVDPALLELTEQIIRRLQAGDRVLAEDYITRHPAWAEPIRRLFPVIRDLDRLGRRVDREGRDPDTDRRAAESKP
jgi:hypothetical protein